MKIIHVPEVVWALGGPEQSTASGVTVTTRPIYYKGKRAGSIHRDYAEPLMKQLLSGAADSGTLSAPAEPILNHEGRVCGYRELDTAEPTQDACVHSWVRQLIPVHTGTGSYSKPGATKCCLCGAFKPSGQSVSAALPARTTEENR